MTSRSSLLSSALLIVVLAAGGALAAAARGGTAEQSSTVTGASVRAQDSGITVEWLGESRYSAQDLAAQTHGEHSMQQEAMYVLYSLLAEGPVWASEVFEKAAKAGVARRTLNRAKKALGELLKEETRDA